MRDSVLVTGAAGNVGKHVVRHLQARGVPVIAADYKPERVRELFGEEVETARLDFHDRDTWRAAVQGVRHMFLMRPPAIADVENNINPFVDVACEEGVEHIVFMSVAGADKNRFVPHRAVEDHLRARGAHHTNLRPGFFAQNLETAYQEDIIEDGRIYVPAGRKPVNWIDGRDIAEAAAVILEDPAPHQAKNYTLTGPEAVEWTTVTEILTEVLERPIRYKPASILGYIWHLKKRDYPLGLIAVQTVLHVLLRFGQGEIYEPTLKQLIGHGGHTIREYIEDHAHIWRTDTQRAQETQRSAS